MSFIKKNILTLITLIFTVILLSVSIFAWFSNSQSASSTFDGNVIGEGVDGSVYYYNSNTNLSSWTSLSSNTQPFDDYLPGDVVYFRLDLTLNLNINTNIIVSPTFEKTGYSSYVFNDDDTTFTYYVDNSKLPESYDSETFNYESSLIQLFDGLEYVYYETTYTEDLNITSEITNLSDKTLSSFTTSDNLSWNCPSQEFVLTPGSIKSIIFAIRFREDAESFYIRSTKDNIIIGNNVYTFFDKSTQGNSNVYKDKTIKLNHFIIN